MATKKIDLKALLAEKTANVEPSATAREAVDAVDKRIPKNLMYYAEATEFIPETKPVASMAVRSLTVEEAKDRDAEMNRFIDEVLVSGVDYGLVPHTAKPTLLKPGAEKILGFLGLVARTEVVNRVEDIATGYFAYETKVYLVDRDGLVRAEGIGIANSKEGKYAKSSGFAVQNTLLKMSKKRSLVDACLNVGMLSSRFTQDTEDMCFEPETLPEDAAEMSGSATHDNKQSSGYRGQTVRKASPKQIALLERLMKKYNSSAAAMNKYVLATYAVEDYHDLSPKQCSEIIDRYMALG